jgi:cytochrome c oxidase assembly factor CtaG
MFEFAMEFPFWHAVEQANFFIAGVLFWYPVINADPTTRPWLLPLYLFLATLPCDVLSAFLAFCGHVVYPHYLSGHSRMFGLSAIEDQALAGALMWFTVTLAYLIPALVTAARALSGELHAAEASAS